MTDMNYNHLYHFHMIAEEGSLSKAAERLALSPSTLSEQLKNVESFLKEKLFIRRATGLYLTDAGRRLHRFTSIMFRAGERLLTVFDGPDIERAAAVDIGITTSLSELAGNSLALTFFRLENCFPRIHRYSPEEMLHRLRDRQLDIALLEQETVSPDNEAFMRVNLTSLEYAVVCHSSSPLVDLKSPSRYRTLPLLQYPYSHHLRSDIDKYLAELGLHPHVIGEVDDFRIAYSAVQQGLCAAVLPVLMIENELNSSILSELSTFRMRRGSLYYIIPRESDIEGPVARVLTALKDSYSSDLASDTVEARAAH